MLLLALTLAIAPWHGADLPTANDAAAKYRLTVAGAPHARVHIKAAGVKPGWIAAFCDNHICTPAQVTETLPASGKAVLQFELIREDPSAPRISGVTLAAEGATIKVPAASP